jgi:hypothetical protein
MKVSFKNLDCAYLYPDGHATLLYKKYDKKYSQDIRWVVLVEKFAAGPMLEYEGKGRLIVSGYTDGFGFLEFVQGGRWHAKDATLQGGSEKTRALGIAVGHIELTSAKGNRLWVSTFPGLISCDLTYQTENGEKFEDVADKMRWCDYTITSIIREVPK